MHKYWFNVGFACSQVSCSENVNEWNKAYKEGKACLEAYRQGFRKGIVERLGAKILSYLEELDHLNEKYDASFDSDGSMGLEFCVEGVRFTRDGDGFQLD